MARTKSPKKSEVKDSTIKDSTIKGQTVTPSPTPSVKAEEADPTAATETAPKQPAIAPPAAAAEPRRLGIVKPDSRGNVVPINVEDEIRKLAYELSARRGFVAGHENEDWLAAEREIRQRYHQRSA